MKKIDIGSSRAFCVKCKSQKATKQSSTVVLQNGSRALKGKCVDCSSDVYKILEKKTPSRVVKVSGDGDVVYPNAFCVKCKTLTPTLRGHTVILANDRRALRGVCPQCSCEIYKILPRGVEFKQPAESHEHEAKEGIISVSVVKTFSAFNTKSASFTTRFSRLEYAMLAVMTSAAFTIGYLTVTRLM